MNKEEKKTYTESLKTMSDREIQELQLFYTLKTAEHTKRSMNNIVFFFWFFIIVVALAAYRILNE